MNPHNDKLKEREEITDVMFAYGDSVLLNQAKDSPNTQKIINNKLERKINTSKNTLTKRLHKCRVQLNILIMVV